MPLDHWVPFFIAAAILLAIPGPTLLTVISYSLAHGRSANIPLVVAVALGDATGLTLSLLGLGAILATSAFLFTVVKTIGGVYLIYLGIKLFRAGVTSADIPTPPAPESMWRVCANAYLVTALNPKGIVFFVAFLPQFIDRSQPVAPQLWIMAITFVTLSGFFAGLYAVFAAVARRALTSPRAQRGFNLAGGSLLSCAGVWALLARRV